MRKDNMEDIDINELVTALEYYARGQCQNDSGEWCPVYRFRGCTTFIYSEAAKRLKEQQKEIDSLKLDNKLIRQNSDELDKQRTAFAMKIEEQRMTIELLQKGGE